MSESCRDCPQERVHQVEYRMLSDKLLDLKERVAKLESLVSRGLLLLVANLVGVITSLARGMMQ